MPGSSSFQNSKNRPATDHKTIDADEHTHAEDKQELAESHEADSRIPKRGMNPALQELRDRKEQSRADKADEEV